MINGIHKILKKKTTQLTWKNQTFSALRFEKKIFSWILIKKDTLKYVQNPYYIYPVTATSSMGLF